MLGATQNSTELHCAGLINISFLKPQQRTLKVWWLYFVCICDNYKILWGKLVANQLNVHGHGLQRHAEETLWNTQVNRCNIYWLVPLSWCRTTCVTVDLLYSLHRRYITSLSHSFCLFLSVSVPPKHTDSLWAPIDNYQGLRARKWECPSRVPSGSSFMFLHESG